MWCIQSSSPTSLDILILSFTIFHSRASSSNTLLHISSCILFPPPCVGGKVAMYWRHLLAFLPECKSCTMREHTQNKTPFPILYSVPLDSVPSESSPTHTQLQFLRVHADQLPQSLHFRGQSLASLAGPALLSG